MSTATLKKEETPEAPSRLDMVRAGNVGAFTPRIPQHGRMLVDINAIVPDPRNERKNFRALEIEQLAATIKAAGIIEPPTVVRLEEGKYRITTGERRWRAAKLAGLKQIYVIIGDDEEEHKRRLKSLVSNIQRADLNAVELARGLEAMKGEQDDAKTNRGLAALIGKSEQWTGGMLKILTLPQNMLDEIASADRIIPYDIIQEIARLDDLKEQRKLLAQALSGATVREIREKAREIKGGADVTDSDPKPRASQKKIPVKGDINWVIVSKASGEPISKRECISALNKALKALDDLEF